MRSEIKGFTLLEILATLIIGSVLLALAITSFRTLTLSMRVKTSTLDLAEAIQTARSAAVKENRRVTLANKGHWNNGWQIFVDTDQDGDLDAGERLLAEHHALNPEINIEPNSPVKNYVSYLGSGASVWATGSEHSAFQAGTFIVCATDDYSKGYALVLSKGGRIRREVAPEADCPSST